MVDRLPKVESDAMRVQRKEDATDERGGGGQQPQEEQDEFAPQVDFKKWTGGKERATRSPRLLWNQRPDAPPLEVSEISQVSTEAAPEEKTLEEQTGSTTITFLRAVGLVGTDGRPRWGSLMLYGLALIGFVSVVLFVINALL